MEGGDHARALPAAQPIAEQAQPMAQPRRTAGLIAGLAAALCSCALCSCALVRGAYAAVVGAREEVVRVSVSEEVAAHEVVDGQADRVVPRRAHRAVQHLAGVGVGVGAGLG